MSYIALSDKDKKEMLDEIGISSVEELFKCIPEEIKFQRKMDIPPGISEPDLISHFEKTAQKNQYTRYLSFLGGGAYSHYIPTIVDYLSSRGEFISPYTPYQAEVSQGTLQIIFEFQTLICQLTGMDIANASLYDGASGTAEAVLMASRVNRRKKVLVANSVHPQYREVIQTYTRNLDITIEQIGFQDSGKIDIEDLESKLDEDVTAVVCQTPNFFGVIEDFKKVADLSKSKGALVIATISEPLSLGILEPPGKLGADIVTGEAQSFGIPLGFGGPYLGFMACAQEFIRQFPGRIAGQTQDVEGKRGFVLTLSTREQHIRRERATSNICTNQALCAVRATIYLEALGKNGLRDIAWQNAQKSRYALKELSRIRGVKAKFTGDSFNEFVLEYEKPWSTIDKHLRKKDIIGGISLEQNYPGLQNCVLVCVTEVSKKDEIERFATALEEAVDEDIR